MDADAAEVFGGLNFGVKFAGFSGQYGGLVGERLLIG